MDIHHFENIKFGVSYWNTWREKHEHIVPRLDEINLKGVNLEGINLTLAQLRNANLSKANLCDANLSHVDLKRANLEGVDLSGANLADADLRNANLSHAILYEADVRNARFTGAILDAVDFRNANLQMANFNGADLNGANLNHTDLRKATLISTKLKGADLSDANFSGADLRSAILIGAKLKGANLSDVNLKDANLSEAVFIETNLENASISGCRIFGTSLWETKFENLEQQNLIITKQNGNTIATDNLGFAQFLNLLLSSSKFRSIMGGFNTKSVLIIGRFINDKSSLLYSMQEELRKLSYTPILLDFENIKSNNFIEIAIALAHIAHFVIVDLTDLRDFPQDIGGLVHSIPIQPMVEARQKLTCLKLNNYDWVLPVCEYKNKELMTIFLQKIVYPAEDMAEEIRRPLKSIR